MPTWIVYSLVVVFFVVLPIFVLFIEKTPYRSTTSSSDTGTASSDAGIASYGALVALIVLLCVIAVVKQRGHS